MSRLPTKREIDRERLEDAMHRSGILNSTQKMLLNHRFNLYNNGDSNHDDYPFEQMALEWDRPVAWIRREVKRAYFTAMQAAEQVRPDALGPSANLVVSPNLARDERGTGGTSPQKMPQVAGRDRVKDSRRPAAIHKRIVKGTPECPDESSPDS